MNRIAFALILLSPAIANAHPGHSHAGMSPYHHLISAGAVAAMSVGGYLLTQRSDLLRRLWSKFRSDD